MCLKEAPQNRCCGQSMLCLNSLCAPTQRQCGPEWLQAILQGRPAPDCQIIPNSTSGVLGQSSGVYCSYAIMDNNERANQHGGLNATMCVCVCAVQCACHNHFVTGLPAWLFTADTCSPMSDCTCAIDAETSNNLSLQALLFTTRHICGVSHKCRPQAPACLSPAQPFLAYSIPHLLCIVPV